MVSPKRKSMQDRGNHRHSLAATESVMFARFASAKQKGGPSQQRRPSEEDGQPVAVATDTNICPGTCTCQETIRKLTHENLQLRRELNDANYRIRTLEGHLATVYIANADDDSSVEVQSLVDSVTSSVETAPTGTSLANENRKKLQQRDDIETLKISQRAAKVCKDVDQFVNRSREKPKSLLSPLKGSRKSKSKAPLLASPSSVAAAAPGALQDSATQKWNTADLSTLFENDSVSSESVFDNVSCTSSLSDAEVRDAVGTMSRSKVERRASMTKNDPSSVKAYASTYFARTDSEDSDSVFEV